MHSIALSENKSKFNSILVVDDDPQILDAVSSLLREFGYDVSACENAQDAVSTVKEKQYNAVLSDIRMPEVSGIELLERIRRYDMDVPVILMTGYADFDMAINAIKKGVFDFITKPFKAEYLISTIEKAVNYQRIRQLEHHYKYMLKNAVKKRTSELKTALTRIEFLNKEILLRLTTAAEFRDNKTGAHIARIGLYSNKIAEALNMSASFVETISRASLLHDIGKIGIPDELLLKRGPLSDNETEIMKSHTVIGDNILSGSTHPLIKMAESIALNHHERWNGNGYPKGIKGEQIPIEGRIVNICDQYDALMSERPYKHSLSHSDTFKIITEGDGRTMPDHFDPDVLSSFKEVSGVFEEIYHTNRN